MISPSVKLKIKDGVIIDRYDELINPIIQQLQHNSGVTIDTLILNLNSVINNEKNGVVNDLTTFSNNAKNFNKFKEDYTAQYKQKKQELENSYKSKFLNGIKDKLSEDKTIEIEFSDNKIIKCDLKDLIKYPYSKLSTYFTSLEKIRLPDFPFSTSCICS